MQLEVPDATYYKVYCLVDHLGFISPINSVYLLLETKNPIKSIWRKKKIYLTRD